ncbi:TPA: oligosaccharide flippase family protein, partial [Klebsiella pneumoniae subsp. pneumoniae]|nr:oligosaccharide flippase family protein [Klebsiella pneumoniae subsp. pneumoniae]
PEFSVCLQYLKDDFYIFISSILSNLYTTTGVVILGMMTSNTEVGLYSSAQKIIDLMRNFSLLPLNMLIFPLLSAAFGHNKEIALEHIRRVMPLFCVFCLLSAVFIFLFGDLIILAFFGEQFSASSLLLKILSIGFVAVFFGVVIGGQVILNLQFDKQFVIMQLIVAIVSLILNFMILPSGGAITTAIIWSFSEVLMTGLQIIFLRMKGINLFYIQYFKPKLLFKTAIGLISK